LQVAVQEKEREGLCSSLLSVIVDLTSRATLWLEVSYPFAAKVPTARQRDIFLAWNRKPEEADLEPEANHPLNEKST